jgi:hypothetical protein
MGVKRARSSVRGRVREVPSQREIQPKQLSEQVAPPGLDAGEDPAATPDSPEGHAVQGTRVPERPRDTKQGVNSKSDTQRWVNGQLQSLSQSLHQGQQRVANYTQDREKRGVKAPGASLPLLDGNIDGRVTLCR